MTIQEIEEACKASVPLDFSRHELAPPALSLSKMFYPFGFPAEVRTNSTEVLQVMDELWGNFEKQYDTEPIVSEVHVVDDDDSDECPPTPAYRFIMPLMLGVADRNNYTIVDLERNRAQIVLSHAALKHKLYAAYFLLGTPGCLITTRYTTPVHAGCVALNGRGVLLCGDSGMGKSTLSYACARAGWTYISDDASLLVNGREDRLVIGDCHRVRFRPTAAELFPEIQGLDLTPRATGKPSIELPTAPMQHIASSQSTPVDFIVFLNRHSGGSPELLPYYKDVARYAMQQTLFGLPETRAEQYQAIERLLNLGVFELRYTDLDWAINRLERLVREGR